MSLNDSNCRSTISNQENDSDVPSTEMGRVNRKTMPKDSEEYRRRRERNNEAVKKSRSKSRQKTLETQHRVAQLREENKQLERRVESLTRELNFMRDIFVPRRTGAKLLDSKLELKPAVTYNNNVDGIQHKTEIQPSIIKENVLEHEIGQNNL